MKSQCKCQTLVLTHPREWVQLARARSPRGRQQSKVTSTGLITDLLRHQSGVPWPFCSGLSILFSPLWPGQPHISQPTVTGEPCLAGGHKATVALTHSTRPHTITYTQMGKNTQRVCVYSCVSLPLTVSINPIVNFTISITHIHKAWTHTYSYLSYMYISSLMSCIFFSWIRFDSSTNGI